MCSLKYTRLDEAYASWHVPVTSITLLIWSLSLGAATNQSWWVKKNKTAFLFPPHFQSSQGHPSLLPRLVLQGGGWPISNGVGPIFRYSHHKINEGCVIEGATLSHVWGSWVPSQGQRAFPTSKTNQILNSCLFILGFNGNPKLDDRTWGFWCNDMKWACHSAAHLQRVPPALSLEGMPVSQSSALAACTLAQQPSAQTGTHPHPLWASRPHPQPPQIRSHGSHAPPASVNVLSSPRDRGCSRLWFPFCVFEN